MVVSRDFVAAGLWATTLLHCAWLAFSVTQLDHPTDFWSRWAMFCTFAWFYSAMLLFGFADGNDKWVAAYGILFWSIRIMAKAENRQEDMVLLWKAGAPCLFLGNIYYSAVPFT